ncbi:MFS transporter [Acidimicrobiia bacterium EGI L10123]|nr:MFS transporter [Acidimicrobiia bacterium EGI L10123]
MAVALPLLAETLTRQPLLFAGVTVANRLPWLLFSLHAGAIADRVDRRRLMATVNALRALLVAALAAAVLTDVASIWLLYAIGFGLGVAETLFDNASQAFLPALVERDDLERANGRLMAGEIVTNQFLGPPLGGFLFGLGAAVPILLDAGTFAISAGLIASLGGLVATRRPARDPDVARPRMRTDIAEGLRWLRNHRLLRGLAVLLGAMNFTSTMLFAVFPLYAVGEESALGLSGFGFGVLLTTTAAGSTIGSLLSARLVTRFGRGPMLWSTLVASVAVPIVIAATSNALVVGAAFAVFGLAVILWNVITVSLRQTIIPDRLLGRVNSVYRFLGWGSMPLGSLAGGAAAALWGVRTTFVLSGLLMAVPIVVFARVVRTSEIDAARAAATPDHP